MAATVAGALKAYLEGAGLGLTVYRDGAPGQPRTPTPADPDARRPAVPLPYITVSEGLAVIVNLDGDTQDTAGELTVREDVQVDLWQSWRNAQGKPVEAHALAPALLRALVKAQLGTYGTPARRIYGVSNVFAVRLLEPADNIVHHAITCTVHHAA